MVIRFLYPPMLDPFAKNGPPSQGLIVRGRLCNAKFALTRQHEWKIFMPLFTFAKVSCLKRSKCQEHDECSSAACSRQQSDVGERRAGQALWIGWVSGDPGHHLQRQGANDKIESRSGPLGNGAGMVVFASYFTGVRASHAKPSIWLPL